MEYPFKDLLPLGEVLERDGYYKDWTHLDPEVFYSLTQISNFIKTKGYGVDVRLLIAQLAEHFGLKTSQVVDLANLLQQKFTNLEGVTQSFTSNINSLVSQMEADKDAVIANATVDSEVILARGGKATLGQRLDDASTQLAHVQSDRAISPDDFEGNDFEKVQSAIDEAIESKKAIRLTRSYNVTNSTPLKLNKKNTRWTLNFIGEGGGFVKTNSGFMFDSDNDLSADINFTSVFFEGVSGSGMTLFNGDKIIILNTTLCVYYNVDKKISSTNYLQSIRSLNDRVTGGQGYFISTPSTFDYLDEGTLCEIRDSYFEQTEGDPNKPYHQLYSARFTGGTIEGITGTAIKVLNTENLLIDGMYMEQNVLGNIVFDEDGTYYGVTISNNSSHSSQANPIPLIKWGGTIYNAKSENNRGNNNPVHDARSVKSGYILNYRDIAAYTRTENLDPDNRVLIRDRGPVYVENGLKTTVTDGNLVKMTSRVEQQTLKPGYNNAYQVPFDSKIYLDDIISVQINVTGTRDITYHYIRDNSNKKNLRVNIANRSEVDAVVSIYATVLKFDRGSSLLG